MNLRRANRASLLHSYRGELLGYVEAPDAKAAEAAAVKAFALTDFQRKRLLLQELQGAICAVSNYLLITDPCPRLPCRRAS